MPSPLVQGASLIAYFICVDGWELGTVLMVANFVLSPFAF
jgi:hypothetical protein